MKYETPFHKARGLGSAKSGLRHWMGQRVSAIALIPLSIWFVGAFILLLTAPFDQAQQWLSSPWVVTLSILLTLVMFYHGYLGMQVILEDYVPHTSTRWILILAIKFLSALMPLLTIVSILKIFLS
jgi:succinate dehydrogenase / fumarate reductase membrane anchor subunit